MGSLFVQLIASLNEFGKHEGGHVGVLDRPAHHGDMRMMTFVVVVVVTLVGVMYVVAVPVAATEGRGSYFDLTPLHRRGHRDDECADVASDVEHDRALPGVWILLRDCVCHDALVVPGTVW